MKTKIFFVLLCTATAFCNSPKPITANPDKHTATSGTLGSAKMTTTLPEKPDTSRIKADTLRNNEQ